MLEAVRGRPTHAVGAVLLVLCGLLGLSVAAAAQEPSAAGETLSIRTIDGRDPDAVEVEFLYTGPREAVTDLVLRENGDIVEHTPPVLLDETADFGIVLAIDASGSMEEDAAFQRTVDAAQEFVRNKAPDDQVAIVSFSTVATTEIGFTTDQERLVETLEGLGVGGGTALFDGVRQSVNLFAGTDLVPNIILLTDGADSDSTVSLEATQGLLDDAGALLFAIGVQTDELDVSTLDRLAASTGGETRLTAAGEGITDVYAEVQASLRRQFRTTFVSQVDREGSHTLSATIGSSRADASFTPGARLDSSLEVQPIPAPDPGGIEALQNDAALWIGLILLVVAAAGLVFAIGAVVVRERSALDTVMQPYADGFVAPEDGDEDRMVTSALLQRAVDATGRLAERQGLLVKIEGALEQANLPLRAGESLFFYLSFVVLAVVLFAALTANVLGTLVLGVIVAAAPPLVVLFLGFRRRKAFDRQLPDMLNLLASTLRAGFSFMQGVEAAAGEVTEPMSRELKRVISETRLGMPVDDALDGVVRRMRSKDFEWAVMAIKIQREVGGNLAELLITVADTMMERDRLRRDVSALTAEGRVSAFVLGALPLGLGAVMFVINPDYIGSLFEDTFGLIMVVASFILMGAGFAWMYKIIDIEV